MKYPLAFYVYALVDPRDDVIFYVGKGSGRRAWQHQADSLAGNVRNTKKHERILGICSDALAVHVRIIAEYDDEDDAFEHEIELISSTPNLTNIRAGGEGCSLDPETIARRAAARALRVLERRKQGKVDRIHAAKNKAADKRERKFLALAGDRHSAEVAAWLDSIRTKGVIKPRRNGTSVTVQNALSGRLVC